MFDDIIKPVENGIFSFLGEINPVDFAKGFEIWGHKTLMKTNPFYKEVILCRNKTEQGQMVTGQQQEEGNCKPTQGNQPNQQPCGQGRGLKPCGGGRGFGKGQGFRGGQRP